MAKVAWVLGANGQVGYELTHLPVPNGWQVVSFDRQEANLVDLEPFLSRLQSAPPDVLINAAAYTAVDLAEKEPDLAFQINATAPSQVAATCAELGVRMVHFSTDYVFDGEGECPYRESDPTGPINTYGQSKLAGEQAVLATDPRHLVLRVSWVYGTRGKNFFLTMRGVQSEGRALRVVNDQVGAPTCSREIARATFRVAESLAPTDEGGLYHLGSGGSTSWFGFAQAIFDGLGVSADLTPISTAEFPTPARRPSYSVLDSGRFQERFGFGLPDWRSQLAEVVRS